MRRFFFAFLLLVLADDLTGQFTSNVDSVYTFMKYNSVHRNSVDWTREDSIFRASIHNAKNLEDTLNCFVQVLRALDDVHSSILFDYKSYGHWHAVEDSVLQRIRPWMKRARECENKPLTSLINENYLYVMVPGYQAWDPEVIGQLSQSLNDSICKYDASTISGVIIDLRMNGGGNIYPMLTGLSNFLEGQVVAYETDADDKVVREWKVKDQALFIAGQQISKVKSNCNTDWTTLPVVVLTSPITSSSGSITAIAFKGRPSTILMGESTAHGYTTSNGYFWFDQHLSINFSTTHVADRNGNIYRDNVAPDVKVNTIYFEKIQQDPLVEEAIFWLKKQKRKK